MDIIMYYIYAWCVSNVPVRAEFKIVLNSQQPDWLGGTLCLSCIFRGGWVGGIVTLVSKILPDPGSSSEFAIEFSSFNSHVVPTPAAKAE